MLCQPTILRITPKTEEELILPVTVNIVAKIKARFKEEWHNGFLV